MTAPAAPAVPTCAGCYLVIEFEAAHPRDGNGVAAPIHAIHLEDDAATALRRAEDIGILNRRATEVYQLRFVRGFPGLAWATADQAASEAEVTE